MNGTVRLVDLVDYIIDPLTPAPNYTDALVYDEDINGFNIGLEYNSQYLANNINLRWKETWAPRTAPRRNISFSIYQGTSLFADGTAISPIGNIYTRLRQEPIIIDYDYAPVGALARVPAFDDEGRYPLLDPPLVIATRASQYVNLYKKPVPILTFTLDTTVARPLQIGALGTFQNIPLPSVDGRSSIQGSVLIKVIEAQYDYLKKVAQYKAFILSDLRTIGLSRWHLTAKVTDVVILGGGSFAIEVEATYGVSNFNDAYGLNRFDWEDDVQQFNIGDMVQVLDSSYTDKSITLTLTGTNRSTLRLITSDDASGVSVGDIIIAENVNSISSTYSTSLIGIEYLVLN